MTGQHIAGVGGQRHQGASLELGRHLANQARLRVDGVDFDSLHGVPPDVAAARTPRRQE